MINRTEVTLPGSAKQASLGFHLPALICAMLFVLTGCATKVKTLNLDSNADILQLHREIVPPEDKDYALNELQCASRFFDLGDQLDSEASLGKAMGVAGQIAGDKSCEAAAVLWRESEKTFRGQPFECASAHLLRGICRYNLGDYSGALAAFRSSLAADMETRTDKQEEREDFAVSHFMAAMAYSRLGEPENAQSALQMAKKAYPSNPFVNLENLQNNFVVVIASGSGPRFTYSGISTAIKDIQCAPYEEGRIELWLDGKPLGGAAEAADLLPKRRARKWAK